MNNVTANGFEAMRCLIAVALVAVGAFVAGCGASPSSTTDRGKMTDRGRIQIEADRKDAIGEFRQPGSSGEINRILSNSKEAASDERDAATETLNTSFDARANHDWSGQCATLSTRFARTIEQGGGIVNGSVSSCAKNLRGAGTKVPQSALDNTMEGPIALLREIGGHQAFAFFHGAGAKKYMIPMEKAKNSWKVASLAAERISR